MPLSRFRSILLRCRLRTHSQKRKDAIFSCLFHSSISFHLSLSILFNLFKSILKIQSFQLQKPNIYRFVFLMILIPIKIQSVFSYFLLLNLIQSIVKPDPEAMRVHPIPRNLNTNTLIHHHHLHNNPTREQPGKNLRRLPHIFNRVLELPLRSEADVTVEERHDCFRFVAVTEGLCVGEEMRAYMVQIHPGITKIVVRTNESSSLGLSLDELELDVWRFRLPESTRPELVTVVCVDGALIVTVPKNVEEQEDDDDGDGGGFGQGMGGSGRLVLVQ